MIFRSFYARLSVLFLLLVLILGGASLIIAFNASNHLFDEVEQLLNREYAASIAGELESIITEEFPQEEIGEAIHYMMVLNPMVEIYLTDSEGKILSYFAGGDDPVLRETIDIIPLQEFHASDGFKSVLGDDPRTKESRKPFSAAPLNVKGETIWVYVILRGQSYDHSLALAQWDYYIRSGLITFFIALLATLTAGLLLFSLLTRRLRKLTQGVKSFKDGTFDHRIEVSGSDEVTDLADAFNEMADSIEEGISRLQEADRSRSELIANISHDLRSPLTSIRGHLETLLFSSRDIPDAERKEFLEITLKNVEGFQRLVEELLDLAKIEARRGEPERITFSLAELVQDVILKMQSQSDRKKIRVVYTPDDSQQLYCGDISLIERALTNIIGNAIEYTPERGEIHVALTPAGDDYHITITDTGEGIPAEALPHIFERFYRSDTSRTRGSHGTGLGLAIAKEAIELHGGTLTGTNTKSRGAVFTIILPITV